MAEEQDVPGILAIYAPFIEKTAITFEEEVPSVEDMWQRIQTIQKDHPYLVCIIDGDVAGYAYYSPYRSRASYRWAKEISVYINEKYYKRQLGQALYSVLFELARAQGLFTMLAIITIPNMPSIYFHEKLGFVKCAEYKNIGYKIGSWQTVGWWQYELFDENKVPGEIIPLAEIISNETYSHAIERAQLQINL